MPISHMSPGQMLPASTVNQIIDGVNGVALQGIVPTSVAGTGVTVSTNGAVTFTGAASVSLNGVFSGTYDNYRVVMNVTTQSASALLNFRLRQGGTDITSATYGFLRSISSASSGSPVVTASTAQTAGQLSTAQASGQTTDGFFDVYGPANGSYTIMSGNLTVWAAGAPYLVVSTTQNSVTSASDGFSIYLAGTGITMNGTLRVYGYNNLA